jgi:hypothetical protein
MSQLKLLTAGNPKTLKGEKQGYLTFILHLSPADVAGVGNMCPKATAGCKLVCLNTAGRGGMFTEEQGTNTIQEARKRKTRWFVSNRAEFLAQLVKDIGQAIKYAEKRDLIPVFRLNGTSDLSWEKYAVDGAVNIFALFPNYQFYDYTKVLGRKVKQISNYHLTFSQAESNIDDVQKAVKQGMNVATVFRKTLPDTYLDRPVFDGDDSDLRFLDPAGVIVGLKAKGKARKDTSGFVVDITV